MYFLHTFKVLFVISLNHMVTVKSVANVKKTNSIIKFKQHFKGLL